MSYMLTREEFKSKVKIVARREHDQIQAWDAVLDCDAALREVIRQAVEDVEKLPHGFDCEQGIGGAPCNCGHDAAIARMKKGLGEKS